MHIRTHAFIFSLLASLKLFGFSPVANAQLIPDDTLGAENSVVTPQQLRDLIEGGAIRGENLFHSFTEFNVNEGQEVFFANPDGIFNILTRVTGVNPSDIFGTLGVDGGANLVFINPNGINFGANASLNVSGSFFATTAESVVFGDGLEFSATNPQTAPLVTVNITPGLQNGTPPQGAINNAGGLQVGAGQNFSLFATQIDSTGIFFAPGGNITLETTEDINLDGSLGAGRIFTSDAAGAGDIFLNSGGNISLTNGAQLLTIANNGQGNTGNVTVNATGDVTFDGAFINESGTTFPSGIYTRVTPNSTGDAGEVNINAGSLSVNNGGLIDTRTLGQGNGGNVNIFATGDVSFDGEFNGNLSGIYSGVGSGAVGDGGTLNINAGSVFFTNGGLINVETSGEGNGGNVNITAAEQVVFDGEDSNGILASGIFSSVNSAAIGNAGDINITTDSLSFINGGLILAPISGRGNGGSITINATGDVVFAGEGSRLTSGIYSSVFSSGVGNAGEVNITANSLSFTNGGTVSTGIRGTGNAGKVTLNATESIAFDGESSRGSTSGIDSTVLNGGEGDAGEIIINTGSLSLTNGGRINSFTAQGQGNAGRITVNASDSIVLDGESATFELRSAIISFNSGSQGDAGEITINTGSLSLNNGGEISNSTSGKGNAGRITINATDSITLDGESSTGFSSQIDSSVLNGGEGNAGEIIINTGTLALTNGTDVSTGTDGMGDAGRIIINATDSITVAGETEAGFASSISSLVLGNGVGNGGEIEINTGSLFVTDGALVSVRSVGQGNAGNVTINADESIILSGVDGDGFGSEIRSDLISEGAGNGGNVSLSAPVISLSDKAFVSAFNSAGGEAGSISVNAVQLTVSSGSEIRVSSNLGQAGNLFVNAENLTLDEGILSAETATGDGGNINLQVSDLLLLRRNSLISAEAQGDGNSGNIDINAGVLVAIPSENSDIVASAEKGGNVTITADNVLGIEFRNNLTDLSDITATGTFTFNTPNTDDPSQGIVNLPTDVIDAPNLIASACAADDNGVISEFYVTGRGGLPPTPEEPLRRNGVLVDLVTLDSVTSHQSPVTSEQITNNKEQITNQQIQEAQGWVRNVDGKVVLTTTMQPKKVAIPWLAAYSCNQ